jgi:alkanesulfonate monooxygenase SsuD/methylene tetrahydromethanopterin reductase-like flavin-dependent oxidoreductase (luciferase family)
MNSDERMVEMSNLKLGLVLPTRNIITNESDPAEELAGMVGMAQQLEQVGYDSIWVGDSLLGRPRPEPLTVLAAIAARTTRIGLGTAALLPAMRHPLQLAQQAATLDLLSKGRLTLGVGTGFPNDQTRLELDALEIPFGERIERCHETVNWCRQFWQGEALPFSAKHWELSLYESSPLPHQIGGPAFWLGGATENTCRTVGRYYDGWMPTSPSPEAYGNGWQIVQEMAESSGRDGGKIVPCTVLTVSIGKDEHVARKDLADFIETYYSVPLEQAQTVIGCTAGTLAQVVERIQQFADAGVQYVQLRFASKHQTDQINRWSKALREAVK